MRAHGCACPDTRRGVFIFVEVELQVFTDFHGCYMGTGIGTLDSLLGNKCS